MNNYCKRKCYWNWKDSCCPETESHYIDGTVYTNNCTQFLRKDFISKLESNLRGCHNILLFMTSEELKKARYLLTQIKGNKIDLTKKVLKRPEKVAKIKIGEEWVNDYRCINCGYGVADDYTHCPHCGQPQDWSVTK